jgi:two-component system, cell cycle sensor histidine kinase and response regulator CckA
MTDAPRATEGRFQALIENSPDVFWLTDGDGRTLYVSPGVTHLLGFAPESLTGKPMLDIHPDDLEGVASVFGRILASPGTPVPWQARRRSADGAWRLVEAVSVSRLDDPAVGAVVSNLRDRTEYELAREAMRESEAQYRAVFDGALDAMIVTNDQGRFLEANPAACELWGLPRQELLQRNITDFAEPGFRIEQVLEAIAASGRFRTTHPIFRLDGTVREVEASTTGGILPGRHFTSLRDLTANKRMEDQLRMGQKMEAVGRLAGGVAHDFNNLLAVITGYGDMLHRELGPEDPRLQRVEQVRKAADRAASLVRQLLAFSRRQVLQPRVLSLADVVEELAPMLGRLIGEDIELVTKRAADLAQVKADAGQIQQVIMNLVVNARDAMPAGGKLLIETRNTELDRGWAEAHAGGRTGPYVMLAVNDTGSGMDAVTLKQVFEPFYTTKGPGKGTGLGLSTVYGIVKQSGGHVWVYSEPGVGTTVKVYLPQVDEITEPARPPRPEAPLSTGSETVLVAEDEESLGEMIREILEDRGYDVLAGGVGKEALELARRHTAPIHLLLTDVVMPGLSGRELAARLLEIHPEARVLYMSGYSDDAIAHHGVLDPGVPFLEKPFGPDALTSKVREVLDS